MSFDLPDQNHGESIKSFLDRRTAAILEHMRSGDYEVDWGIVTSDCNGHHGEFKIFADALKIGGVRINVSASLEQAIADILGCLLMTPKISDLCWQQKSVKLVPSPQQITSSTKAMQDHSARVDAQITKLGIIPVPGQIIRTVGKDWVISNKLAGKGSSKAENYGWHFEGSQFGGQKWEPAVLGGRLIQGEGWAHDPSHVDYSQICCLVHRQCTVDGQQKDLLDIYTDPDLCCLVSHEGPLKITRQPGTTPIGVGHESPDNVSDEASYGYEINRYGVPVGVVRPTVPFGDEVLASNLNDELAAGIKKIAAREAAAKIAAQAKAQVAAPSGVHTSPNPSPHPATHTDPHGAPAIPVAPADLSKIIAMHPPILKLVPPSKVDPTKGRHTGAVPSLLGSPQFKPGLPVKVVSSPLKDKAKRHAVTGSGAIIGFFVGGPIGAAVGAGIGWGVDYYREHKTLPFVPKHSPNPVPPPQAVKPGAKPVAHK